MQNVLKNQNVQNTQQSGSVSLLLANSELEMWISQYFFHIKVL